MQYNHAFNLPGMDTQNNFRVNESLYSNNSFMTQKALSETPLFPNQAIKSRTRGNKLIDSQERWAESLEQIANPYESRTG